MSATGLIWLILGAMVVGITKYVTSIRLRGMADRMQRDHQDAGELRFQLAQAEEKGSQLTTEADRLKAKVMALSNVVTNLEKSMQRHSVPRASSSQDD